MALKLLEELYVYKAVVMIRIILALILATIAFSIWGYVWYATVFDDVWQSLIGRSETALIEMAEQRGGIQDVFVVLISLVQAAGIFFALKFMRAKTFWHYMGVSVLLSTLLVLPSLGNTTLFVGTPLNLLLLDYGHFLLGYAGMALVFFIIDPPSKKAPENSEA